METHSRTLETHSRPPRERPFKRSVALVIREPESGRRVLAVLRPPDDEELPDAWGLPAASLGGSESWEQAVRRAGREKLGVEVEAGGVLAEGSQERPDYRLEMRLYAARIARGQPEPRVGRPLEGATRYADWRWADPAELEPAAARGSLCTRLFLQRDTGDGGGGAAR